jgi:hypothetical protein
MFLFIYLFIHVFLFVSLASIYRGAYCRSSTWATLTKSHKTNCFKLKFDNKKIKLQKFEWYYMVLYILFNL